MAPPRSIASRSRRSATSRRRSCGRGWRRRTRPSTTAAGRAAERRARLHYRLRGFRILAVNARAGGNELDVVVRRGRRLVFCEVKAKTDARFGDPFEMVGPEKRRRLRRAASAWLAEHPELGELEISFELVALRGGKLERLSDAF